MQTPNKDNFISDDALLKLNPIDIIDDNKVFMKMVEGEYGKNKGKENNLMEFVKNLNEYVPQYKLNNQIHHGFKRNKSKSKSVCENEDHNKYNNFKNIQNQIYQNKVINGEKNNNNIFIKNK